MSKTRMGKRVASLLLSLVMMLSLLPTTVYAEGADTGDTTDEIVGQATTSGDNTEGTGEPEPTGEGEDGSANVTEGEDGAATNDAVVEETIAPVNAEGVDAVANAESSGDEVSGEDGNELVNFVTVNGVDYATLEAAIGAATPDANSVITYTINGKVEIGNSDDKTNEQWISVVGAKAAGTSSVKFVGNSEDAEISLEGMYALLANQGNDLDVSFENLKLSHPGGAYKSGNGSVGHMTNYFACVLRNTNAAENTVTYTNCTFPNGVCNNQYGKTVFDSCKFTNAAEGKYNLWNYGGNTEVKNSTFTGVRGIKTYNEGTLAVAPTVKVENTTFTGLSEKAAIVASKATDITLTDVTATGCGKGLLQKDIENSGETTAITANGEKISGEFNITAGKGTDAAKKEFNISAGTFTSAVDNGYLADGFEIKESTDASGNTTYGVEKAATAVAKIGEKGYETLADAIAAAKDGDIVTLLADTTEDVTINKNITLDLGGKTLTNTNTNADKATISVSNGATATVKNGSVMGGTSYYNIEVTEGSNANLTLEGVTATAGNTGSSMIDNWGTLTINSGTYTGGLDTVKNESGAKLTITGGEFTLTKGTSKGFTGVVFNYGALEISGGTFIQSDKSAPYGQAQVIHTDKSGSNAPSTMITGGTFKNLCSRSTAWTVRETNAAVGATKVSGGTFNKSISDGYCADGFIPTKNGDGTYGVKEGQYVAQVGNKKYETLADAIRLAANGGTIKLLADVTENVTIAANKNLTLDLNGKTLNGGTGTAKAALTNYGTIIIKDSSTAKTGTIKRDDNGTVGETSYYVIDNKGTMTIESGNVRNNSGYRKTNPSGSMVGSSLICNGDDDALTPVLNIKGGKFVQENFIAIKNDALGVLHVTGGTITSEHSAIQNWFEATITGGTINGQLWTDAFAWKEGESVGKTTIGGDAKFTGEIVMDVTGSSVPPTLEINGGNLSVKNWRITTAAATAGAKPAVSGGTFTSAVPENYCAEGYTPVKNVDGTYGVVEAATAVAQVGETTYATLQAAIDAAKRNDTVKMLANTRENVTISTSDLTLDLNGFTLNGGTEKGKPALKVDNARVTVKDSSEAQSGTIMREDTAKNSGVSSHYVIDIQGKNALLTFNSGNVRNNSGNAEGKGASLVRVGNDSDKKAHSVLTIAGGTFTQDNFIVIKVDFGTLHLKGGTVSSKTSYAVENWLNANIKGDAVVNGAVSSWTYSTGSNSTLEISGGTVNGNVESVSYDGAEGKLAKVKITGGTVNGTLSTKRYNDATAPSKDMATIEVTGGTFDKDPSKYVVEDSAVTPNADGTFGVAKAYLAQIGETFYYTMDEAFKAQTTSGEPIVMLRDYTTGSSFWSGSINRTVDLNGHTWTCTGTDANSAAFEINYSDVTLTVKNGKVVSSQLVGLIPSAMGGTITYNNSGLLFDGVVMTTTATSGIETNGNNTNDAVTLKDSTLNVPNGFGIYFPSSGTLTIDNSTINAKTMGVQVCAGSLSINSGSAITVTGDAVPKTENDGAIQDGAAISIVNRAGYKGLGDVTVTGGTFTAKADNKAIKAYDWDNTNKVEKTFTANGTVAVSGGTFSSIPDSMAALCKVGYRAVEDKDNNVYIVKEGKYVIEVTSRIQDTNQTVATPTGGGQADYGEEVTVTTYAVTGFTFLGWYDSEGNQLSTKDDMTYTHKVTGDCTLIAKYTAVSGGTFRLEVNASKFIVDGKTKLRYVDMRINAATEVVVEYTGTDKFLYWINGSNNVVSTEAKITLVAVGNFKLTAVVESTELGKDHACVIFKNAFVKGQSLSVDYYTSSDSIVFPSTPVYVGRTFKYWGTEVNGEIVEAKQVVISGLIKGGAKTVIIAPVYESNGTYTVTVNYVDANGNQLKGALTKSGIGTGLMEYVTADEKIGELIFSHWEIGGKNVGTNKTYAALSRTDGGVVALTAVYVTEGTVTKPENVLTIAATGATIEGGRYAITFTANYSIGEAAAIAQGGILYWNAELSENEFTVANSQLRKINWDKLTENFGACDGTVKNTTASVTIYARAYIVLENGTTIYSNIVHASYNDIAGK